MSVSEISDCDDILTDCFDPKHLFLDSFLPLSNSKISNLWNKFEKKSKLNRAIRNNGIDCLHLSERSQILKISGKELSKGCIGCINGIATSLVEAKISASNLCEIAQNHQIEWVYNCSHSAVIDIFEAFVCNYKQISAPAILLKKCWEQFHDEHINNHQAKYLQLCHSQGAIHVKNALLSSSFEIKNRIIVVAISPAAIIPESLCYQAYNYASSRDFVPYAEIITDSMHTPYKIVQDYKALKELIILESKSELILDHEFYSETFAEVISNHIESFIENYR